MAIYRLQPEYSVRLSYNVSRSIFVQLLNKNQAFDSRFIKNVVSEMKKIVEADYPLTRRLITKEEAKEIYKKQNEIVEKQ